VVVRPRQVQGARELRSSVHDQNRECDARGIRPARDIYRREQLVDKPNHADNAGCMAGQFKLIDSADATNSLIYMKLPGTDAPPPCGLRMPVIGNFAAKDRTCILSWIESVIAATR